MERYRHLEIVEAEKSTYYSYLENINKVGVYEGNFLYSEGYTVINEHGECYWVLKEDFEKEYSNKNLFNFSVALKYLKVGCTVRRKRWKPSNRYVYLKNRTFFMYEKGYEILWTPSQEDMLAYDWSLYNVSRETQEV